MKSRRPYLFALGVALTALACKKVLGLSGDPQAYDSVFVESGAADAAKDSDTDEEIELPGDAACGANRRTDPKNCGSCGHDCLGAKCQAGRCVPEKVTDVHSHSYGVFAVRDGTVYTIDGETLVRNVDGGPNSILVPDGVGAGFGQMLVDEQRIVWTSYTNGLRGCPIGGGATPTQISPAGKPALAVTKLPGSTAAWPYVWLGASKLQTFGSPTDFADAAAGEAQCTSLTANDAYAFYGDFTNSRILTIKRVGNSAAVTQTYAAKYPCGVFARGNRIFWADVDSIWRATIENDGTITAAIALAKETSLPNQIAADDQHVYWASTTAIGTIYRCNVDGCDAKPQTIVSGLPVVPHLALDGPYVYFSAYGNQVVGNQIWRVPR